MADTKTPAKRGANPLMLSAGAASLPAGNRWFGFEQNVLKRNTLVVQRSSEYLGARTAQTDSYIGLIDARMRLARKIAEIADLPNVIIEEQSARAHARWQAHQARLTARTQALYDTQVAAARNEIELTRLQEAGVRAQRNLEAAQRVAPAEIDRWYAEAQARSNNAKAEYQDTVTDLGAAPKASAGSDGTSAEAQKAEAFALIDHQIELERTRRNDAAVLALLNLKAMLKAASA